MQIYRVSYTLKSSFDHLMCRTIVILDGVYNKSIENVIAKQSKDKIEENDIEVLESVITPLSTIRLKELSVMDILLLIGQYTEDTEK